MVVELTALYRWLLLWLIVYFDPLFQVLKHYLKVQERTFCCISTDSFALKTGAQLLSLHTAQHRLLDNIDIVRNKCK